MAGILYRKISLSAEPTRGVFYVFHSMFYIPRSTFCVSRSVNFDRTRLENFPVQKYISAIDVSRSGVVCTKKKNSRTHSINMLKPPLETGC